MITRAPIPVASRPMTVVYRGLLMNADEIRALMAEDMRDAAATRGSVSAEDLKLIGWTASQIIEHSGAAADLARRNAIRERSFSDRPRTSLGGRSGNRSRT